MKGSSPATAIAHPAEAVGRPPCSHWPAVADCARRRLAVVGELVGVTLLFTICLNFFVQYLCGWSLRHAARSSYVFLLEPFSSTDTVTVVPGISRGYCGEERWPSVRRLPTTCWSGQHPNWRQHGNMIAISAGTKQHTLSLSSMHGLAHSAKFTYSSGRFLQSTFGEAMGLPLKS